MMNLKLIGVLQDFGTPYASLYRDNSSNSMYVSIEQDSIEKGVFYAILFEVSRNLINLYLEHTVGLREMSKQSTSKYLWSRRKGSIGNFTELGTEDVSDKITEDDTFDEFFCKNMPSIQYYINEER